MTDIAYEDEHLNKTRRKYIRYFHGEIGSHPTLFISRLLFTVLDPSTSSSFDLSYSFNTRPNDFSDRYGSTIHPNSFFHCQDILHIPPQFVRGSSSTVLEGSRLSTTQSIDFPQPCETTPCSMYFWPSYYRKSRTHFGNIRTIHPILYLRCEMVSQQWPRIQVLFLLSISDCFFSCRWATGY